jgi:hypothetical protein
MRAVQSEVDMWQFLTSVIAKRRLRTAFGQYLSEDMLRDIQEMSNGRSGQLPQPEQEDVCYVALQVRGDTTEEIQRHLAQAIDVVLDHGGMVDVIMSSIVTATFNPQSDVAQPPTNMLGKLGPNVRAVYGRGEYLRGLVGSSRRFSYGTIFPHIQPMLETLFALEFGTAKEA